MDDGWFAGMQVIQAVSNVEHQVEDAFQSWRRDISDVIEQITIFAELTDEHAGDLRRVFGYTYTALMIQLRDLEAETRQALTNLTIFG